MESYFKQTLKFGVIMSKINLATSLNVCPIKSKSENNPGYKSNKSRQNISYPLHIQKCFLDHSRFISFGYDIKPAERLGKSDFETPKYINEITRARSLYGDQEVIELGMGNPDILPPQEARKALVKSISDLWSHRYNFPKGEWFFRKGVSDWFDKRFGVKLDPGKEIMMSAGASDGVDLILAAYTEKGDKILVPDPGYTVYRDLIAKNDLQAISLNLDPENSYLPDFDKIKPEDIKGVKGMIINYPHNPMGAFAPLSFYEKAVKFAKDNNIFIIHDFDNTEITHYGDKPVGILQSPGAKEVAFEVHTLSKAHNMPGMRVGFVASNEKFIDNILKAKLLTNNSVYTAIQSAAVTALQDKEGYIEKVNEEHRKRKTVCIERLKQLGSDTKPTQGTYYLWVKIPDGFKSDEFFKYVLHKAHVAFTPGTIYGKNGEGYVRVVMSAGEEKINEAFDKLEKANIRFDKPKYELSEDQQIEIERIARDEIELKPKAVIDIEEYKIRIAKKHDELTKRFDCKPEHLKSYLPDLDKINSLPTFILKDNQLVYLKNTQSTAPCMGRVKDIMPFSNDNLYHNIFDYIENVWVPYAEKENPKADIRRDYTKGNYYPDATYFAVFADDKTHGEDSLQGIVNLEMQHDGAFWVRNLNTAPWNQGEKPLIKGVGSELMARVISFCIETDKFPLKLATNKQENIEFYQKLGFKKDGIRKFFDGDVPNQVFSMDKEDAMKFLDEYQRFLSY